MINFIQNHPLLVIITGIIIALLLVLAIIKVSNPKGKKSNKIAKNSTSSKTEKITETKTEKTEKTEEDSKEKKEKEKKEKKVEQVYKSEKKEDNEEEKKEQEEKDEKDLLEKMAFVKTTKTISKLAKREWIEKVPESEFTTEELIAIDSLIREKEIYDESKKSSHFNKSVRLSNFTKSGNYDEMFLSHISDNRTHISTKRHLNINNAFMERLYIRTYKALERSGVEMDKNVIAPLDTNIGNYFDNDYDTDGDTLAEESATKRGELAYNIDSSYKNPSNSQQSENDFLNDSIDLSSENILVVDTVMNRKNRRNK